MKFSLKKLILEFLLMSEATPIQNFSLDSSEFISYSCSSPSQKFVDTVNGIEWDFRQGGAIELDEAIVIIPDIFDSTNSTYLIASSLIEAGYRVIVISIPPYPSISTFLTGFDLFTASNMISKAHLVGFGFGGYLSLCICNFSSLSVQILSLAIISGYMNTSSFKKSGGIFGSFMGKSDLHSEVFPSSSQFPSYMKPAATFEIKELESIPSSIISTRVKLRQIAGPVKPPQSLTPESILIVQPTDWAFKMEDSARPQKAIEGANYVKIPVGGHLSHLANAQEMQKLLKEHLQKWHSPLPDEELDNEEEEEDKNEF